MRLIEYFDRGARMNPDGMAFVTHDRSVEMPYSEVETLSHRIAAALHREGLRPQAPVAILSGNSVLAFPCVLGVLRSGCAWVALNARSTMEDMVALLDLVEAQALLFQSELAEIADQIGEQVASLLCQVEIGGAKSGKPTLAEWIAPADTKVPLPPLDGDATTAFFGTGGTTGRPKVVEIPNRAFETMIHAFLAHLPERSPVHLVAAPLTHAAGTGVFPVLTVGGTNVVHKSVDPGEILSSIERNQVTRLFLPPTAIYSLLTHDDVKTRDLSSLEYFLYGAAPMSVEKLKAAIDTFGPVMAQFYGQTELPMLCAFLSPEEHVEALRDPRLIQRLRSCGRPSVVADIAIMDDTGQIMPSGASGEIVVRSSLRMTGYHKAPHQTAAVQRPGGWQATGDIGYLDTSGYLYIVDRKRDLIISGGFNVFPSEVEQVLWEHPAVRDCAVIGLPDEKWGERVTAVVEVELGQSVSEAELISLAKKKIGSVRAPKEVIFRSLPRSDTGKILKRQLRDEYWRNQDRLI
ncbi:AMP-binding protein [Nocardia aobensis]|uniref:AMP-binding protein n=1 Tax=Nocardia aobensis TaxID=257277 RepID=UPI0002F04BC1|nr:AMP-binding protein [Nocardia aobensis]